MQLATQNKTRCSSECNGNKTRRARTFCFDALLGRNSIGRSHCSRKASSEIASLTCVYGIPGRTTGARASPSGPAPHRLSCSANLNRATCPLDQPDVIGPPIQPKIDIRVVVSERASGAGSLGASRDLNSGLLRLRTITADCERDVLLQSRIRDESPAHGQAGNSTLPSPSTDCDSSDFSRPRLGVVEKCWQGGSHSLLGPSSRKGRRELDSPRVPSTYTLAQRSYCQRGKRLPRLCALQDAQYCVAPSSILWAYGHCCCAGRLRRQHGSS